MNEQLQLALSGVIESATNGAQAGVSFLNAELPEVIHQLLMWKMVESLVLTLAGLLAIVTSTRFVIKNIGRGDKVEEPTYLTGLYKYTLTHGSDGDPSPHSIATTAAVALIYLIAFCQMSLDWLQIWIAPKVYLIEYAASLVK